MLSKLSYLRMQAPSWSTPAAAGAPLTAAPPPCGPGRPCRVPRPPGTRPPAMAALQQGGQISTRRQVRTLSPGMGGKLRTAIQRYAPLMWHHRWRQLHAMKLASAGVQGPMLRSMMRRTRLQQHGVRGVAQLAPGQVAVPAAPGDGLQLGADGRCAAARQPRAHAQLRRQAVRQPAPRAMFVSTRTDGKEQPRLAAKALLLTCHLCQEGDTSVCIQARHIRCLGVQVPNRRKRAPEADGALAHGAIGVLTHQLLRILTQLVNNLRKHDMMPASRRPISGTSPQR